MKTIIRWMSNLFRYFYIFSLAALFLLRLYSAGNIKKDLWKILLCIAFPFVYGTFVKILVKTKNMLKLRVAGARKRRMYTLFLLVAAVAMFLAGGILVKKQPFLYSGGGKERFYDFIRQMERMGAAGHEILLFVFPFAAFPTLNSIKKQQDIRAVLWLFMADLFLLTGMFSAYGRVCWYVFFVFSLILSLQYIRLYYREVYGDAVIDIPKKAKKSKRKKKRKKKKGIGTFGDGRTVKKFKKGTKRMTAPRPAREFGERKERKKSQASFGVKQKAVEQNNLKKYAETEEYGAGEEDIEISDIEKMLEQNAENARKQALFEFETDFYQEKK